MADEQAKAAAYVPPWRIVYFPTVKKRSPTGALIVDITGYQIVYDCLEKANNGRIWARAFTNLPRGNKERLRYGVRWTAMARHLKILSKYYGRTSGAPRGMKVYTYVTKGQLPKNTEVRQALFDLAGYPWK